MALTVDVKLESFPIISKMKNPVKVRKMLKKHYARAAFIVGRVLSARMRRVMTAGLEPANSPMTSTMKGSSKPLFGTGDARLFKSITHRVQGDYSNVITVGVHRNHALANVARIVHDGTEIVVTPKMATMFQVLHSITMGRGGKATSERARELLETSKGVIPALRVGTVLTIEPRPFAAIVFANPETKQIIETQYKKALKNAFEEFKK